MPGEKVEYTQEMKNNEQNFIFGVWPILEALKKHKPLNKVLIQKSNESQEVPEIIKRCHELKIPIQTVPVQKLQRITRKNHQGIIAFTSPIEFSNIDEELVRIYEKGEDPFLLILDRITDVRNFGAICRTAEAAGVHAILIPEKESAMIGGDAMKTSAGAIANIPICRTNNLYRSTQHLQESGVRLFGCTEKGSKNYKDVDYSGPIGLIMGSEENGISDNLLDLTESRVFIPMMGQTGSLNVSVACGILLYEMLATRQD